MLLLRACRRRDEEVRACGIIVMRKIYTAAHVEETKRRISGSLFIQFEFGFLSGWLCHDLWSI